MSNIQPISIDIWSKTPAEFIQERKNRRTPIKTKHWGVRYAVYSALITIGLQAAISIFYLIFATSNLIATGVDAETANNLVIKEMASPSLILIILQLSMYVSWIGTMFYVTYRKGLHSFAKDFWLRFKWKRDILLGLTFAIGLRAVEFGVLTGLEALGVDLTGANNTKSFVGDNIWAYILMFGIASFIGPVSEELFFRGLLLQGLIKSFRRKASTPRTWFGRFTSKYTPTLWRGFVKFKEVLYKNKYSLAVAISSVLFGFMHFQGAETFGQWLVVILTGSIGLILAIIVIKTRRLGLAITTHVAFNASAMILVFLGF